MVAGSPCSRRLAGVCLARLQDRLFDGQFYLDDLGLFVGFTRWFHFFLLIWVFFLGRPRLGERLYRRDTLPAARDFLFRAMPSQGIDRTEK